MQQHSKEWLGQRAREILERNASCNKGATSTKKPATTVMSQCCRTAFNYWLVGERQPFVMIAGPVTLAEAEDLLRSRFDDRFFKVERLNR